MTLESVDQEDCLEIVSPNYDMKAVPMKYQ